MMMAFSSTFLLFFGEGMFPCQNLSLLPCSFLSHSDIREGGLPCVALPHFYHLYPFLGFSASLLGSPCAPVPGRSCLAFLPLVGLGPAVISCRAGAPLVLAIFVGGASCPVCSARSCPNWLLPASLRLTTPLPAPALSCFNSPRPLREIGHLSSHGLFDGLGGPTSWFSQRGCSLWHPG